MLKEIKVEGMSCNHCKMAVTNALKNLENIDKVDVNLESGNVTIEGTDFDMEVIKEAISDAGYSVVE